MESMHREQFVLNGRWLFDTVSERLIDLDGRMAALTLSPVCARVLALFAASPQSVWSRRNLFGQG